MRIKQLNLISFGPFKDYELNFAESNQFNLIYGLNEAGKSTILRAIRDFLYGIPLRSPDAYLYPDSEMRIKALLETADGRELKLTRRKGRKNTLLNDEGEAVDENILQQHLSAIDREAYALMFGMDHHSLRRGGEDLFRGKGALGEALFEAASGISGMRTLLLGLDQEAGDLFKPSGSRPPLNENIRSYKTLKRKVQDFSMSPHYWSELEERYLQQKKEVERLKEREREIGKRKTALERLKDTLPLVARRERILGQVALLGDLPLLPDDFKEKYLQVIQQREEALRDRERSIGEKKDLEEELKTIVVPEELLGQAQVISALQQRLDTYRSYSREIPSLDGEISGISREALALLRRLKPSFSTLEQAESLRLPLTVMEETRQLAGAQPLLVEKENTDEAEVKKLAHRFRELEAKKAELGPLKDVGGLNKALKEAARSGEPEKELRKTRSRMETLETKLTGKLSALGLWSGTLPQLQQLPLPLPETVRTFEERFKKLHGQAEQISSSITAEEKELADSQNQLTGEELTGEVTEEKLEEARQHRQQGWHLIRRAWFEGGAEESEEQAYCAGQPLHLAYEMSVTGADKIADRLRYETARVERTALLQDKVNKCRLRLEELAESGETTAEKVRGLDQEWSEAWQECAITPLTPPEMLAWLSRCQELRNGLEQLDELTGQETELDRQIKAHREMIGSELLSLDEPAPEETGTLETLIERAQEIYEKYQAGARELQSIEESLKETEGNLAEARQKKAGSEKALAEWQGKWIRALGQAGLPEETAPQAVLNYLNSLEKLFQNKDELSRKQARLDGMKTYTGDFKDQLQALLVQVGPDLVDQPADSAAEQLSERVIRVQRDQDRQESLRKQAGQAEKASLGAAKILDEATKGIEVLMKQARCREEREIPEVIEKVEQLAEFRKEAVELEGRLLNRGAGLSLDEIVEEAGSADGDALPGRLSEVEQELGENRREQDELNRTFGVTQSEYNGKVVGSSLEALEAEEEAQGVLAELSDQAEDYLRLRLASIVLRRSIDRYREENQSPVIKAAGKLFARLTGGSFSGLEVDFDEKDNPVLLGARLSKEKTPVGGMSDGTLDQLYLSLRLAGLERYLEQNEPLPFILDDLLVNFDDIRSAETLKVLGEFAEKTQVLFFTHHQSLVDLAQKAIPRSKMIELN